MTSIIRYSTIDQSVNFITPDPLGGAIEARYVRRTLDKVSLYLSSMTGCDQLCKMCHLTHLGELSTTMVDLNGYKSQLNQLFDFIARDPGKYGFPTRFEINFMARGDALLNPEFLAQGPALHDHVKARIEALYSGVRIAPHAYCMNVSTIFPFSAPLQCLRDLAAQAPGALEVFYSAYSLNAAFRKRWLPNAKDPQEVFPELGHLQTTTGLKVTLHHCIIKGENDDPETLKDLLELAECHLSDFRLNIVRFNPPNAHWQEADQDVIISHLKLALARGHTRSRIVDRVGVDVAAACGMFLNTDRT